MTAREAVCLNESVPQLQVPQAADTYLFPRDCAFTTAVLTSSVADGASAVGFTLTTAAMSTAGASALLVKNNTTSVFRVSKDGGVQIPYAGQSTHTQASQLGFSDSTGKGATGQYSFTCGWNTLASGLSSGAGGADCIAAGAYALAFGGGCEANGDYSFATGNACTAAGNYSAIFGRGGSQANRVTLGIAGGNWGNPGDAMVLSTALYAATTNATQTTMTCNDTSFVIPADTAWCFSILIVGRSDEADGNDVAAYRIEGAIKRDESNNTALVGSITKTVIAEDAGAAAWDVTAEADDTNEALAVKVTGEAATNIRWVARVDYAHVNYA